MRLAKYNEVVVALVGTALLIGILAIAAMLLFWGIRDRPNPGVVLNSSQGSKAPQNLVLCSPLTEPNGLYQYIPVGVVVAADASSDASLGSAKILSRAYRGLDDCGSFRYSGASSRTFNVVVRNLATGEQRLLLQHPAQVSSFDLPDPKCSDGEGQAPCGSVLWQIRTEDTNHDGTINSDDALIAYSSGLDAQTLTALTPITATLMSAQWVSKAKRWQFQVRRDTNGDGAFSQEDGSDLLETSSDDPTQAKPFVSDSIRKVLDAFAK